MQRMFGLSKDPCCTQTNQCCCDQDPANQLKPLCEWSSHGFSGERVIPQRRLVKFFQQRVGFQLLARQQQSNHLVPNESAQAFCLLSLMPGLYLDRRKITRAVVKS